MRPETERLETISEKIRRLVSAQPYLREACERCLRTERWGGSVVLMVVDAALTSSGLSYFDVIVPKVKLFSEKFVETGQISTLTHLSRLDIPSALHLWRSERCWRVAKDIAAELHKYGSSDKEAIRRWASQASLSTWRRDPVGSIKGVGLVTFQYLRMMGGVDTIMPDRVVKRVVNRLLAEAEAEPVEEDLDFIEKASQLARMAGVRPIELCWMAWLLEGEGEKIRSSKDPAILLKI